MDSVLIHPVCVDSILELIDAMNIDQCTCQPCVNWMGIRAKIVAARYDPEA